MSFRKFILEASEKRSTCHSACSRHLKEDTQRLMEDSSGPGHQLVREAPRLAPGHSQLQPSASLAITVTDVPSKPQAPGGSPALSSRILGGQYPQFPSPVFLAGFPYCETLPVPRVGCKTCAPEIQAPISKTRMFQTTSCPPNFQGQTLPWGFPLSISPAFELVCGPTAGCCLHWAIPRRTDRLLKAAEGAPSLG